MAAVKPIRVQAAPVPIDSQAIANLRFIRRTMEQAGQFTAIPGRGGIVMGVTAIVAAAIAHSRIETTAWLSVWTLEAVLGVAIGFAFAQYKARASGTTLLAGPGKKFVLALLPSIVAAAALTLFFWRAGTVDLAPPIWLLLYGCGIVAGGAYSVRLVPLMGVCFLAAGVAALFTPLNWSDAWLAATFGGLQIVFGSIIAVKYGG
jgi:hypothetical protein